MFDWVLNTPLNKIYFRMSSVFLELEFENYYYYSCKWSQLCQFISRKKHKRKGLLHEIELKILLLLKLEICADFSNNSNNFLIICWSVMEKQRKVSFYMLFLIQIIIFLFSIVNLAFYMLQFILENLHSTRPRWSIQCLGWYWRWFFWTKRF